MSNLANFAKLKKWTNKKNVAAGVCCLNPEK